MGDLIELPYRQLKLLYTDEGEAEGIWEYPDILGYECEEEIDWGYLEDLERVFRWAAGAEVEVAPSLSGVLTRN